MSRSGLPTRDSSFSERKDEGPPAEQLIPKVPAQSASTKDSTLAKDAPNRNNEKSFSNEKFRKELVRSLKARRAKTVQGRVRSGEFKRAVRSARFVSITAVFACTLLMSAVYATLGPAAWGSELTTLIGDTFVLGNSKNSQRAQVDKDTQPPKITQLNDVVVEATGPLTIVPITEPRVMDNLDPAPTLTNSAPPDGYPVGTHDLTWTAEDNIGNIATALQKVTVVDTTPPTIIAPENVVVYVDSPISFTQVPLGRPIIQDIVDSSPNFTNDAPSKGFPVGVTTVMWKAVDAAGNSATDTQLVSVRVTENVANTDSSDSSSTTDSGTQDTTSSNADTSSSSTPIETSTPASTASGVTSSGSTSYSGGFGGGGGGGGGGSSKSAESKPTSDPEPDQDGSSPDSSNQTDNTPPTIVAPSSIFANATGLLTIVSLGAAVVNDTVDATPTVTNNAPVGGFPRGTTIVIWTATDDAGNFASAEQRIVIEDKSPPMIIAPANIVAEATDFATPLSLGSPIVIDLADASPLITNDAPVGYLLGNTTVTWMATDATKNSATAVQLVTIIDTTPPIIIAPSDRLAYVEDASQSIVIPLGDPYVDDFADNAPAVTNDAPSDGFRVGNTTVTWRVTDAAGYNASDTQIVTILLHDVEEPDNDSENPSNDTGTDSGTNSTDSGSIPGGNPDVNPPTIIAPPNISAEATGLLTLIELGTPTVTDDKDPNPTTTNDSPSDGFPLGTTLVTWTATDASGNSASAIQNVTISDTGSPILTVPDNIIVEAVGPNGSMVNYTASAFDVVDGSIEPVCEPVSGALFAIGTTTVTCTAADSDSNIAAKTFDISVQDASQLTIIAPADITVESKGILTQLDLGEPTVSNFEDPAPNVTNDAPADGFPIGTTIVTWIAADASGNTATAQQNVTAHDTTPPSITAPADVVVEATGALTSVSLELPTVSDLVDQSPIVINDTPVEGFPIGTTTVTWTALDEFGNYASATQQVSVVDNTSGSDADNPNGDSGSGQNGTNNSNNPPLASAGTDQIVLGGSHVTLDGTGSTDPDSDVLTYSWVQSGGTLVTLADANTANPSFTAPVVTITSTLAFTLTVSDGNETSSDVVEVTVNSIPSLGYVYSPAYTLTGSNYFGLADSPSLHLDTFSVSAWFKTSEDYHVDSGMIANKGGFGSDSPGQNLNYGIWMDSVEKIKGGFESSSGTDYFVSSTNTYNDSNWHYAVVTYDGAALNLYIDGKLVKSLSTNASPDKNNVHPFRIGANSQANNKYFVGEIDEVGIWERALSSNEVGEQYYSGIIDLTGLVIEMNGSDYDVTPPTIVPPPNIVKEATGPLTIVNLGVPTVTDLEDASPIVAHNAPADGFPVGITTVTWKATDTSGNIGTATQKVTITDPSTYYTIPTIGGTKPTKVTYGSTVHTVCDSGCTHTTIKGAIDALPADGGKVVLKGSKTFTPSSTTVLRSNLVIEFEAGTSIEFSGSGKVFSGKNVNNVMFINPVISRSTAEDVLYFTNADTIIVQGGKITGTKGSASSGFECKSCKNVLVQGNVISTFSRPIDVGTASSTTDGSTKNVWIVANTVSNSSVECIKMNRGHDMHAIGNNVRDCTNNGIDLGYNVGAEAKNNILTNTGYGSVDNAVGFHTDSARLIVIVQNTIDITGTDGIRVCGSDDNYVVDNKISNTGRNTAHESGNGISVIACTGGTLTVQKVILDGNQISDTRKTGIYITASTTEAYVTTNSIKDYGTNAITDASKKATISGNTIN
jgi:uncharacterized membrane protein YgcG